MKNNIVKEHPQPEPVAWRFLDKDPLGGKDDRWVYLDNAEFKSGVNPATFNLEPVYTSTPQRKPLTDAPLYLVNLVDALDNAFISSWQSTHGWQQQLDDAREYITKHGIKGDA